MENRLIAGIKDNKLDPPDGLVTSRPTQSCVAKLSSQLIAPSS